MNQLITNLLKGATTLMLCWSTAQYDLALEALDCLEQTIALARQVIAHKRNNPQRSKT